MAPRMYIKRMPAQHSVQLNQIKRPSHRADERTRQRTQQQSSQINHASAFEMSKWRSRAYFPISCDRRRSRGCRGVVCRSQSPLHSCIFHLGRASDRFWLRPLIKVCKAQEQGVKSLQCASGKNTASSSFAHLHLDNGVRRQWIAIEIDKCALHIHRQCLQ